MYAVYRTPRHGSAYFINLVNTFGRQYGFAELLQVLTSQSVAATGAGDSASSAVEDVVPIPLVTAVLELVSQVAQVCVVLCP